MFLDTIPAQRACRMRLATRQRIEGGETLSGSRAQMIGFRP
jgi:hypothetical protein